MYSTKTATSGINLKKSFTFLLNAGLFLFLLSACQSNQIFQQRFLKFGTVIDITLITEDQSKALHLFDNIETLLTSRHTEWHGWEDGTLKQFNRALHTQSSLNGDSTGIEIPHTLKRLITDSKKYYDLSEGLFNPALGKLIDAWGFHKNARPDYQQINAIKKDIPGMHDLIVTNNYAKSLNPNLQLDFGAIAKGLAIKQISSLIRQASIQNFVINAGGDIFTNGKKRNKKWRIAVENPFHKEDQQPRVFGQILTSFSTSVFTSGNYRRFYKDKNKSTRHHIINPLTGEPSDNISAITVLHQDPVVADVAATTLMLTPVSELKKIASKLDIQDFLAISDQKELYISRSMKQKIQGIETAPFKIYLL